MLFFTATSFRTVSAKTIDFGQESIYASTNPIGERCKVIANDYYKLCYPEELQDDGELAHKDLQQAIANMIKEFGEIDAKVLLKENIDCTVYIYAKPNKNASEAMALINSGVESGKYIANLHFLALSKHSPTAQDSAGRIKDKDYFLYLITHEYSTIILERLTERKRKGWTLFTAPSWFVQGYEQYLGLKYSKIGKETLAVYLKRVKSNPGLIYMDSYGLHIQKVYEGGALVLAFMNEAYGQEKVHSLLTSDKPTFFSAMESTIDKGDDFAKKWSNWLQSQR